MAICGGSVFAHDERHGACAGWKWLARGFGLECFASGTHSREKLERDEVIQGGRSKRKGRKERARKRATLQGARQTLERAHLPWGALEAVRFYIETESHELITSWQMGIKALRSTAELRVRGARKWKESLPREQQPPQEAAPVVFEGAERTMNVAEGAIAAVRRRVSDCG